MNPVRGIEAAPTTEQPRLRVQPCAMDLVRNANLRTKLDQPIDRSRLSDAYVDGGEDSDRRPPRDCRLELIHNEPQAAPLHERAEQIDSIS